MRGQDIIPARGRTRLAGGDHAFLVVRPELRALVDRVFAPRAAGPEEPLPAVEFPLSAKTTVAELTEFYGIEVAGPPEATLEELLRSTLGVATLPLGATVDLGNIRLRVREVSAEGVEVVGIEVVA